LWKFTLEAVETYGHQLKQELEEIVVLSEFSKALESTVKRITRSFYTQCGARPGKDTALVAALVCRWRRHAGDSRGRGSLEDTDEILVLGRMRTCWLLMVHRTRMMNFRSTVQLTRWGPVTVVTTVLAPNNYRTQSRSNHVLVLRNGVGYQ
jgi:hypothetical protein